MLTVRFQMPMMMASGKVSLTSPRRKAMLT